MQQYVGEGLLRRAHLVIPHQGDFSTCSTTTAAHYYYPREDYKVQTLAVN